MTAGVSSAFDTAFVCVQLQRDLEGGLKSAEIHSVTYLACLLSIYDGCSPGEWEYVYTSTKAGTPFSAAVDDAILRMLAAGALVVDGQLLLASDRGHEVLEQLKGLPSLRKRERYLEPACSVTLTMPLPAVTEALLHEPQLQTALALRQLRPLLDETGLAVVRPHIEGLHAALGSQGAFGVKDLLVPAILWLSYLSRPVQEIAIAGGV